ncbi:uncharacterized protein [Phyllobates terribilis]|uniref:uncharacterized protein n=1 Tax=Phyllobates terribilis TaxID=111132 RepID=UPI003CCAD0E8
MEKMMKHVVQASTSSTNSTCNSCNSNYSSSTGNSSNSWHNRRQSFTLYLEAVLFGPVLFVLLKSFPLKLLYLFQWREIEKYPEIWNRASDCYKDKQKKKDAWASVLREIYPQWVNADHDAQEEIMCDVKSRWRSVTDRLVKYHQSVKSGASPRKRKVPYADELAFMLTSRSLRRTEGKISAPSTETDARTDEVEEEFHPIVQLSSPETSASATDVCHASCSVTEADVDTGLGTAAPGPSAAGSSTGDVLRPTGRGSASARLVALRRATKKKGQKPRGCD